MRQLVLSSLESRRSASQGFKGWAFFRAFSSLPDDISADLSMSWLQALLL
jgi:hypothetical protein